MLDNLFNSSDYGQYLADGAADSYQELQRRLAYVNLQQTQQAAAMKLSAIESNSAQQAAIATTHSNRLQQQIRFTNDSLNYTLNQINNAQNMAEQVYQTTTNTYMTNLSNLRSASTNMISDVSNGMERAQGTVRAAFGASDIIVDTGSARDVAIQAGTAAYNQGQAQYSDMLSKINNNISAVTATSLNYSAQSLSLQGQRYLTSLNYTRSMSELNPTSSDQ